MKLILVTALLSTGAPLRVREQAAPASAPLGVCPTLAADWRRIEQNMADRVVDDLGDNSAPRATLRETRESNDLALATMTVQIMRENKCPQPKRAPNSSTYLMPALDCSKARREAGGSETPAACKRENWTAK